MTLQKIQSRSIMTYNFWVITIYILNIAKLLILIMCNIGEHDFIKKSTKINHKI